MFLLAKFWYRKDIGRPSVRCPPAGYGGWSVHDYALDDDQSNACDAGIANTNLEQLPATAVFRDGTAYALVRPRSVGCS